MKIKFKI